MDFVLPVTSDKKTQPSREARFGRQRFLNASEQTSVCTRDYVMIPIYSLRLILLI